MKKGGDGGGRGGEKKGMEKGDGVERRSKKMQWRGCGAPPWKSFDGFWKKNKQKKVEKNFEKVEKCFAAKFK